MLSQQKNPPGDAHSLQLQIAPNNNHGEPDLKPFSIRQYALACREKDVFSSWPFPEKYLHICLDHGINDVLPPLESHTSAMQSLRGAIGLNHSQQDDKNVDYVGNKSPDTIEQETKDECKLYSEEAISELSILHCHSSPSNSSGKHENNKDDSSPHVASNSIVSTDQPSTTIPSSHLSLLQCNKTLTSSRKLRHKQQRQKGKHKKRSMVDILGEAKPCTMEDLLRIKRLCCISSKPLEQGDEVSEHTDNVKHNCESDLTKDCTSENLERVSYEAASPSMLSRKRWVVKFKFSSYKCNV